MSCTRSAPRSPWSRGGSRTSSSSCRSSNQVPSSRRWTPTQPRTWMELLFLSFTNLSSTGLSDVVPITAQARSVVMIEQLAGLGYVALFVSRLVGLTIAWQMTSAQRQATRQQLMAQRLLVVAHAPTPATQALVFGEPGELLPGEVPAAQWVASRLGSADPRQACQATAARLGGTAEAIRSCVTVTSEHGPAGAWSTLLPRIRPGSTPGCATRVPRRTAARVLLS